MEQLEIDFYNEWKQIPNFEGVYDLRNDGLIHCLPRKHTKERYTFGNELPKKGYLTFLLSGNEKRENKRMHRLVWETFVGPIPKGYDVHHINHNKKDNRLENLCLIESHRHKKIHSKEQAKPVLQYTLDSNLVSEYPSIMEAERQTGINSICILKCCKGKLKTSGHFIWKYKEVA